MEITKNCPFCGERGLLVTEKEAEVYSTRTSEIVCVKCISCGATSQKFSKKYLGEFTNYTVQDFRNNPILRAQVEDEYDEYCKEIEKKAASAWERRNEYVY